MSLGKKSQKTNAMRLLDKLGISYELRSYDYDESDLSGLKAASAIAEDPVKVFKTLLCINQKQEAFVFVIPVAQELDLKLAAQAAGQKSLQLAPQKDLLRFSGYLRGGCSPLAMKKLYPSFLDQSALEHDYIVVSAGKRGLQLIVSPLDLMSAVPLKDACLCRGIKKGSAYES